MSGVLDAVISIGFHGLAFAMVLYLISVGLSVTMGLMGFVNLAHGVFAMLGGYVLSRLMSRYGTPFALALPAAAIACAIVSVPLERLLYRRFYSGEELDQVLLTMGLVFISVAVFSFFVSAELKALWSRHDLWKIGLYVFVPQLMWGFYQEFLYRGLLQTELVRRWGTLSGILVSNLIFTFGPLHAYHFALARANPAHLWIFAATFSIGMFFAVLFKRSGNLWIVAFLHGLGDWFIDGLAQVSRMPR